MLVILQFSITLILLAGTFAINRQLHFMQEKDLGMNMERVLVVEAPFDDSERANVDVFRNELLANPSVTSVAISDAVPGLPEHLIGTANGVWPIGARENGYAFHVYAIDEQFIDLMDMQVIAGKNFQPTTDSISKIMVNEETLKLWEINDPETAIGLTVDLWGRKRTVTGVVQNFHQLSVKSPHLAMILFHITDHNYWNYANIKISGDHTKEQIALIESAYEKAFPGSVFTLFFMDERYDSQYHSDQRFFKVFRIMTLLAIIIACLGLFGLVSFTITQKTKEIGIRKVLGASISQILALLSNGFLKLIFVSVVISVPLAYFGISSWLQSYPYRIDIYWWMITLPVVMIFFVALISISVESIKAATRNPVEALRYE